jgi:hypothetical protein
MDVLLPYKTVKGRFVYSPVTRGILFTTIALSTKTIYFDIFMTDYS